MKKPFLNKKLILFATRSASLLERALRCRGYHTAGFTTVLTVSEDEVSSVYVYLDEWNKLVKKYLTVLSRSSKHEFRRLEREVTKAKKFVSLFKETKDINQPILKDVIFFYGNLTEIIVFTHLMEKEIGKNLAVGRCSKKLSYLRDICKKLSDRLYEILLSKIKKASYAWYLPKEILEQKNLTKKEIEERKAFYVSVSKDKKLSIQTGSEARKLEKSFKIKSRIQKSVQKITGNPVSLGRIQGRVYVVHRIEDLRKIKPGRVIVAHMTEPRMNLYLQNSKAIVTNEGGLISHATIFAREMGIPCIASVPKSLRKSLKTGIWWKWMRIRG